MTPPHRPRLPLFLLFGRLIAGLRQELGESQPVFAERSRLSVGVLTRLELGQRAPTLDVILLLERYLIRQQLILLPGELTEMTVRLITHFQVRGVRLAYGRIPDGPLEVAQSTVDAAVAAFIAEWRAELAGPPDDDDDTDYDDPDPTQDAP